MTRLHSGLSGLSCLFGLFRWFRELSLARFARGTEGAERGMVLVRISEREIQTKRLGLRQKLQRLFGTGLAGPDTRITRLKALVLSRNRAVDFLRTTVRRGRNKKQMQKIEAFLARVRVARTHDPASPDTRDDTVTFWSVWSILSVWSISLVS